MLVVLFSNLYILSTLFFGVGYIQTNNLFPEPLSSKEEKYYLRKMINENDNEARNILIEHNLRLVVHVAKKYQSTNIDQNDLISIGSIGLIKGISNFNPEKNFKLATYVAKCIENEILMYLRSNKKRNFDVYLNEPIGKDKDDNEVTLQEVIENDEKNIEDEIDLKFKIIKLHEKMKEVLKEREKRIIEMRYGLNGEKEMTQKEIAKLLNMSRSYVSRIESKAVLKLSKEIKS